MSSPQNIEYKKSLTKQHLLKRPQDIEWDILSLFRQHANPAQAAPMAAYMRNICSFLGINKPLRATLQKPFLKEAKQHTAIDWEFVNKCWTLEREFQYLALDYLRTVANLLTINDIPNLRQLAVTKSWWDTIDCLDRIVGGIALRDPKVNEILLQWSVDDNFWLRRIAIDHQLLRKERTDTALLEKIIINNLGQKEFFINKAIGWSLREYSKTNPAWVRDFIAKYRDRMANLSIREASKYILKSANFFLNNCKVLCYKTLQFHYFHLSLYSKTK
ncbi:MAG: DNA alkylation repair protein [Prevotellaceae bacterium]|nr:DNA alkylation repair protein [Prevotellaceae bacterium]